MNALQIFAVLVVIAASASYVNHRYFQMPATIGLMALTLAGSLFFVLLDKFGIVNLAPVALTVRSFDFADPLLHGILAFLLFAGALHIDLDDLKQQALPVTLLASIGVIVTCALTGAAFWLAAHSLGFELSCLHALLFGALIAPTDPIAVIGILKKVGAPRSLETKIAGESLFNDGVGVVLFLSLLKLSIDGTAPSVSSVALSLVREALGGIALGLLLGWSAFLLLRSIDAYKVEALLTLAVAAGGYGVAESVHVSAPITVVVAGLIVGNHGRRIGMSEFTRKQLDAFWEILDEIMNALLFVLMGLQIIAIKLDWAEIAVGSLAIVGALASRFFAISMLISVMRLKRAFSTGVVKILTWCGLRGGISIALALSLPPLPHKDLILTSTYMVVIFSVLVQGLTVGRVIRASGQTHESSDVDAPHPSSDDRT